MRIPVLIISAASLVMLAGVAKADDHLFQAGPDGVGALSEDSQPFQDNPHGFNPEEDAPGQGSPFTGDEQEIPATGTASAHHGQELPDRAGPKN
jgi:hypothetical protein